MFYVVEAEEKIVGFSIVNLNKSLGKADIENVYIDAQYRKHGIGRKLLNTIIEELKEKGFENVNCLEDLNNVIKSLRKIDIVYEVTRKKK